MKALRKYGLFVRHTEGRTIKRVEDHSEGLAFIYFAHGEHRADRITNITGEL